MTQTSCAEDGPASAEIDRQIASPDPVVDSVVAVCRWIEEADVDLPVAELAERVGWSSRHLSRIFKDKTGVTIAAYKRGQRSDRVRTLLRDGTPVTDAVFGAGYGSMRAFYEHGAPQLGTSPNDFRRGAHNTDVRYTTISTALGEVIVAATDRGVCAVRLGDDAESLIEELRQEFPAAAVGRDDAGLDVLTEFVRGLAEGREAPTPDIPLDVQGTAFQVRVWEELRTIPSGSTVTYSELASRIGEPAAHRAVANACGANPTALVVPCHRVVRSDGSLGGYRWGVDRKESLLAVEGAND